MAAQTWYLTNNSVSNGSDLSATDPGTEAYRSPVSGWVVSTGSTNRSEYFNDVERAATTFSGTTVPDGSLDTTNGDFWTSPAPLSGDFASANWTISVCVRANTNGGTQDGLAYARIFRGVNQDGTSATEVTSAATAGTTVTDLVTTTTQTSTITINPGAFSVTNEYIFIQLAWGRTGAGGMTTSDVNLRIGNGSGAGSRVVTSSFTYKITTGRSDETDASITLTRAKKKAVGLSTETDTALALAAVKTRAAGLSTETDAAQTLARIKTRALTPSNETDAAQTLAPNKTRATALASEADTALALSPPAATGKKTVWLPLERGRGMYRPRGRLTIDRSNPLLGGRSSPLFLDAFSEEQIDLAGGRRRIAGSAAAWRFDQRGRYIRTSGTSTGYVDWGFTPPANTDYTMFALVNSRGGINLPCIGTRTGSGSTNSGIDINLGNGSVATSFTHRYADGTTSANLSITINDANLWHALAVTRKGSGANVSRMTIVDEYGKLYTASATNSQGAPTPGQALMVGKRGTSYQQIDCALLGFIDAGLTQHQLAILAREIWQLVRPVERQQYWFGSAATSAPVGLATETDTALAATRSKAKTAGIGAETDTALALARSKTRSVGVATEADTAIALARTKARATGLSAEADTARQRVAQKMLATESDASITLSRVKARAVGIALETDTAKQRAAQKLLATETDTALALTRAGNLSVGLATETDSAFAAARSKARAVSRADETDAAIARSATKSRAVGMAIEVDTAQLLTRAKSRAAGIANESDIALGMGRVKTKAAAVTASTNTALPLGVVKQRAIGAALESAAALALARIKARAFTPAGDAESAVALARCKSRLSGLAAELDEAFRPSPGVIGAFSGKLVSYALLGGDVTTHMRVDGTLMAAANLLGGMASHCATKGQVTSESRLTAIVELHPE